METTSYLEQEAAFLTLWRGQSNTRREKLHGTLGERWAREWVEERRREMVRRDLDKQTERHPWINSGII